MPNVSENIADIALLIECQNKYRQLRFWEKKWFNPKPRTLLDFQAYSGEFKDFIATHPLNPPYQDDENENKSESNNKICPVVDFIDSYTKAEKTLDSHLDQLSKSIAHTNSLNFALNEAINQNQSKLDVIYSALDEFKSKKNDAADEIEELLNEPYEDYVEVKTDESSNHITENEYNELIQRINGNQSINFNSTSSDMDESPIENSNNTLGKIKLILTITAIKYYDPSVTLEQFNSNNIKNEINANKNIPEGFFRTKRKKAFCDFVDALDTAGSLEDIKSKVDQLNWGGKYLKSQVKQNVQDMFKSLSSEMRALEIKKISIRENSNTLNEKNKKIISNSRIYNGDAKKVIDIENALRNFHSEVHSFDLIRQSTHCDGETIDELLTLSNKECIARLLKEHQSTIERKNRIEISTKNNINSNFDDETKRILNDSIQYLESDQIDRLNNGTSNHYIESIITLLIACAKILNEKNHENAPFFVTNTQFLLTSNGQTNISSFDDLIRHNHDLRDSIVPELDAFKHKDDLDHMNSTLIKSLCACKERFFQQSTTQQLPELEEKPSQDTATSMWNIFSF